MSRRFLLEQIDDVAVVQCYADGFEALPLEQKLLAWHLYQAALAGRDIYYDQRCRDGLDMRAVLEQVLLHTPSGAGGAFRVFAEIRRYTKLFWINSGPYNGLTSRKFVLRCTPAEFGEAVRHAHTHGARFPCRHGETLESLLSRLHRPFFDADFEPMLTSKTPEPGRDILTASANNLYAGVSLADLDGFRERYALNSRLIKSPTGVTEQVYRVGGRYDAQIVAVVDHLRSAAGVSPPLTRRALEALIRFYESGEREDRVAYDIAWVQDRDAVVDTINGFVEVYLDPRGVKGAWEAVVFMVNSERTDRLRRLAEAAPWFEARMPWKPEWRRTEVVGVTARAVDVLVETGDAGPLTALGINLPNDEQIRERYGSKSVLLANIAEAYERAEPVAFRREFCWSEDEALRAERWGATASDVATAIHEVLGHGSGRVSDRLEGQPQVALRDAYSSIEETRADLVALYFIPEPRIAALGLLPAEHQADIVRTEYEAYARTALVQLRRVRAGTTLEEDHMRNRQLIVHWLLVNTVAIDVRLRDDRTFYVVADVEAFRAGVARLLAEVQDIKSEGDYERASALVAAYGTTFDAGLRDQVVSRADRHGLPSYTAFVQPRLELVRNAAGQAVDVSVSYPMDLERQMLEYSGAS